MVMCDWTNTSRVSKRSSSSRPVLTVAPRFGSVERAKLRFPQLQTVLETIKSRYGGGLDGSDFHTVVQDEQSVNRLRFPNTPTFGNYYVESR
jgi:hypothetical protein